MMDIPDFELIESAASWRDGGYYYGKRYKTREFTLECYFESINHETFESMMQWLSPGVQGRQAFDDRPFVYYDAVVWKKPTGKVYCHGDSDRIETTYSGTMSIFFKAYNPFGKLDYVTYENYDMDGCEMFCGMIEQSMMPPNPDTDSRNFLIYNPGTIKSDLLIRIGGKAPNGLKIVNETTGEQCVLLGLPDSNDYLEIDSETGSVKSLPTLANGFAFEFHDSGYIRLAPSCPYDRNVSVVYDGGSNDIFFPAFCVDESYIGRYIYIDEAWRKIVGIRDDNTAIVLTQPARSGAEDTMIACMNNISIFGEGIELTKLEFSYIPYVR